MKLFRPSVAASVLVALDVAVWLLQVATGVSPLHPGSPALIAWGGNLPLYSLTGDTWRLLTSVFLHGGLPHLVLNMLALIVTADRTEDEFGTLRMLVITLVGGVLASCASALSAEWHATHGQPAALVTVSVGASGAIMAQFGALLVALVVTPPRFQRLPPDKRPGMDLRLVLIVAGNLVLGALVPHVDQAAHVGGLLAGMALGGLMAAVPEATGARAATARYAATAVLATLCIGALLHFAPRQQLLIQRALWHGQQAAKP
jgi:rhomboid protease GluP